MEFRTTCRFDANERKTFAFCERLQYVLSSNLTPDLLMRVDNHKARIRMLQQIICGGEASKKDLESLVDYLTLLREACVRMTNPSYYGEAPKTYPNLTPLFMDWNASVRMAIELRRGHIDRVDAALALLRKAIGSF